MAREHATAQMGRRGARAQDRRPGARPRRAAASARGASPASQAASAAARRRSARSAASGVSRAACWKAADALAWPPRPAARAPAVASAAATGSDGATVPAAACQARRSSASPSASASAYARCAARRSEGDAAASTAERTSGWRNAHPPRLDGDQPRRLGLLERGDRPARRDGRRQRGLELLGVGHGHREHGGARRRPRGPRAGGRTRGRSAGPTGTSAPIGDGRSRGASLGELDERERVAARRLVQPGRGVARRPAGRRARRAGRAPARRSRPGELQLGQPGAVDRATAPPTRAATKHGDGVGEQPPGGEDERAPRTARRATGSRPRARRTGRSSASTPSRPSVAAPTRCRSPAPATASPSAPRSAAACGAGSRSSALQHGPQQRVEAAEGDLDLRLDAARAQHERVARRVSAAYSSSGGLADPRLAAQHERGALARPGAGQDAVDHIALAVAAEEGHPHSLPRAGPRGRPRDPRASARRASPARGGGELAVYASASRECEWRGSGGELDGRGVQRAQAHLAPGDALLDQRGRAHDDRGGDLDGLQDDPVAERVRRRGSRRRRSARRRRRPGRRRGSTA